MSPELAQLRDAARGLLARHWPASQAPAAAEDPARLRQLWRLAAEQGWTALAPDAEGLRAALLLQQELGRAAAPLPLAEAVLAHALLPDDPLLARLEAGDVVLALAWEQPGASLPRLEDGRLQGRADFVEHAAVATHVLLPLGGQLALVEASAPGLSWRPTPGLAAPALAELHFAGVPTRVLPRGFDPVPLLRLLLAARALGAAQRGLELLTDYVQVRVQFGRRIGEYQAIQHKLANCLMAVEATRLAVQRAGCSQGEALAWAAPAAVAIAGARLRQVALELHHGFGGISFWDGHEMPRHFRRVHADLVRFGGVHAARGALAARLINGTGRLPDLDIGAEAGAFRAELRAWLAANWDGRLPETGEPENHRRAQPAFSQKLGAQGWLGLTWPKRWGGQERPALEQLVFEEEMAYADAPITWHNTSVNMLGPAMVAHASEAMCARFLPAITRGEICMALGYSEPDHGSDLAGLRTRATRTAEGWRINGQKIFTSHAGFANWIWLAVRTNPDEPRHKGISVLLVPLPSPGITVQPMHGLNGHRANIVFFDDVLVPHDALVGEENQGWKVITAALALERVTLGAMAARARGYFEKLVAELRRAGRDDALARDRIGALAAEIEAARLLALETALAIDAGRVPLVEAAMLKVHSSELLESLAEAAFDLLGAGAALQPGAAATLMDGRAEYGVRDALLYTIGGGTNEIQRSMIAQRGLGLPR